VLLTRSPKQVFSGMAIAAYGVGARHGILYLRAEYSYLRTYLERQIADLRGEGVLGDGFDIRIQLGAGAYICGDESALIESCEGKRERRDSSRPSRSSTASWVSLRSSTTSRRSPR